VDKAVENERAIMTADVAKKLATLEAELRAWANGGPNRFGAKIN
jgi:hypothetical protein